MHAVQRTGAGRGPLIAGMQNRSMQNRSGVHGPAGLARPSMLTELAEPCIPQCYILQTERRSSAMWAPSRSECKRPPTY